MQELKHHNSPNIFTNDSAGDMAKPRSQNIDVGKVVSAGFAGLAGGAAIATAILGRTSIVTALVGSLIAAVITGSSEYKREKRKRIIQ